MGKIDEMIASWVRAARKEAGLSQEALGARLALELGDERGFTKANVSHWETQKHSPNLRQLMAIAKITQQSLPDEFLGLVGEQGARPAASAGDQPAQGLASMVDLKAETAAELRLLSIYRLANEREREAIDDRVDEIGALIETRTTHKTKRAS